jgi:addiction module HigA family antidote
MMKMGMQPGHPGEILKEMYIDPLGLTITDTAKALGVARKNLSAIVNGKMGISADMAVRLSEAFNTSAELWVGLQKDYDLWHSEQTIDRKKIRRLYQNQSI